MVFAQITEQDLAVSDLVAGGTYEVTMYTETELSSNSTEVVKTHHLHPNSVNFNVSSVNATALKSYWNKPDGNFSHYVVTIYSDVYSDIYSENIRLSA